MARLSARRIALNALRTWRKEKRFADSIISESLAKAELAESDRAFAFELFYLFLPKTAPHAAVHETVELVPRRQRPIVNGMLRAAIQRRSELLARADGEPLFVRASHPQFLVQRWHQHFGAQHAEELCKWNNLPAPIYGRINQLRIDREEF